MVCRCVQSLLDTNWADVEIIVVDDCSPDNSISIVEEYARKHTNLVIVRNQYNRKLGGARNAGMDVATGQYIWFVDSDDFVENNCFQKLLTIAESEDLEVLHFNYVEFPESTNPKKQPTETSVATGADLFFNPNFVWYDDLITAWGKLYKRTFLLNNNIHFAEHIMYEDNDYAIEVFAKAKLVKHVSNVAYFYRNNPESITRVKYTFEHIGYWLNLAHRLHRLRLLLIKNDADKRFKNILSTFIRYNIGNLLNVYRTLDVAEKTKARPIVRKNLTITLLPYMSKSMYVKLKLGLLCKIC